VSRQTLLRIAIAGLGLAAGLALLRPDFIARAAEDGAAFALKGQLTQGGWARGVAPKDAKSLSFNGRRVPLAPDGGFFIAFDRDSGPKAELRAELADGAAAQGFVTISPRAWQIERIPLGPRKGAPPNEDYARRRAGELALINAARRLDHDVAGWRQKFIWPVYGRISGRFGSQRIYNGTPGSYHSGIDIATGASGTPFVAPADGVVTLAAASSFSLEGRLLMIDHGMGLNSAFLHASKLAVKQGDVVRQGQYIGNIGMTGRATGPHLHWSLKWNDARLDPLLFTGGMGPR
jgi:murein DD-endopeptidase MepM/ murein hydrolase activator NlpD